ncbi:MAG: hypothetical protein MI861_27035 [Pirellulales bacterium]|nr:hypothetical protein [Pirellulales bacterium]
MRPRLAGFVALLLGVAMAFPAAADDFSTRDRFFAKLSTSMTSIQDGKPFRDALMSLAAQVELNLWLDRKVDPTIPVSVGPAGPTVSQAIAKIAAQQDCVVMPIANVMLVGRPAWVDATAAALLAAEQQDTPRAVADVRWQKLATPLESLQAATNQSDVRIEPALPHDLWPAVEWKQIDRRVAVVLILSQFERQPRSLRSLARLQSQPMVSSGRVERRYSVGSLSKELRQTMQKVDRGSRFQVDGGWLEASGTMEAHRAAVAALLARQAKQAVPAAGNDQRRFSLKQPLQTSAENALRQLAQTANLKCVILPEAMEACRQRITVKADNNTLKELIEKVAGAAGVTATWKEDHIEISLP